MDTLPTHNSNCVYWRIYNRQIKQTTTWQQDTNYRKIIENTDSRPMFLCVCVCVWVGGGGGGGDMVLNWPPKDILVLRFNLLGIFYFSLSKRNDCFK
jgi:hypothetical protein